MKSRSIPRPAGFTLTELAMVLFIVALLIGGMLLPLSAQDDIRRMADTQKTLQQTQDALLGFVVANGRLPCPASSTSSGLESFCGSGSPLTANCSGATTTYTNSGTCSNPYDGYVPAATLGLTPNDGSGYLIDAWQQRVRYAVATSSSLFHFTETPSSSTGIKGNLSAGLSPNLVICSAGSAVTNAGNITGAGCSSSITSGVAAVVYSVGKTGATRGAGSDETHNPNALSSTGADPVFVNRDQGDSFDDILVWISPHLIYNRLAAANKL